MSQESSTSAFTGLSRPIQGTLIAIGSAKFTRELPAEVSSRWRVRWSIDACAARRVVVAHTDILGFLVDLGSEPSSKAVTVPAADSLELSGLHELKKYAPIIGIVPQEQMTRGLEALRDGRCEYVLNSPIRNLDIEHIIARRLRQRAA